MGHHSKLCAISALAIILLSVPILLVNAQSENTASRAITEAEQALVSAHEAIVEADIAGANVSSLLDKTSSASDYLAEANIWYRLGDFEKASQFAGLSSNAIESVRAEAFEAKDAAEKQIEDANTAEIRLSIAGLVIVLVSCPVAWFVFKRIYQRSRN